MTITSKMNSNSPPTNLRYHSLIQTRSSHKPQFNRLTINTQSLLLLTIKATVFSRQWQKKIFWWLRLTSQMSFKKRFSSAFIWLLINTSLNNTQTDFLTRVTVNISPIIALHLPHLHLCRNRIPLSHWDKTRWNFLTTTRQITRLKRWKTTTLSFLNRHKHLHSTLDT